MHECNICLNTIDTFSNLCITKCQHRFCFTCVMQYVKTTQKFKCPTCRTDFIGDLPSDDVIEANNLSRFFTDLVDNIQDNDEMGNISLFFTEFVNHVQQNHEAGDISLFFKLLSLTFNICLYVVKSGNSIVPI